MKSQTDDKSRTVYLEPPWLMHSAQWRLVNHPPPNYQFLLRSTPQEKLFKTVHSSPFTRMLLRSSDLLLPTGLIKSMLERNNKIPDGTALTYSVDHLVFRPEPWILEMEFAFLLAGRDPRHLKRFRHFVRRSLESPYCRQILTTSEAAKKTMLSDLPSSKINGKVQVVHYTIPPQEFRKEHDEDQAIRLLFVGADILNDNPIAFDYKGGREVIEAFKHLSKEHPNLELICRGRLPDDVRPEVQNLRGFKAIENFIPREELVNYFKSADIFVMPSHVTIPHQMVEAMSFELPVVTTTSWANGEYIEHSVSGLVVEKSKTLPYYFPGTNELHRGTQSEFENALRQPDPQVVADLIHQINFLIQDKSLRRKMGMAGRWEVEHGKFSLESVNRQLGHIFDEAIDNNG